MIQVFSSFANDIIVYKNNLSVLGWPALWIENALQKLWASYQLTKGKSGKVMIEKDSHGEDRGIITEVYQIPHKVHLEKNDVILISTLQDEFDLTYFHDKENTIFLDIQGFLRTASLWKKRFNTEKVVSRWKVFIKATQEEFLYCDTPPDSNHTYIITDGGNDIELIDNREHIFFPVHSWDFSDTIGAGDTFLASLCAFFSREWNIENAMTNSTEFVYDFLTEKNQTLSNQMYSISSRKEASTHKKKF